MQVKVCGITDAPCRDAAVRCGARFLGFVFFSKSPRHLSLEAAAHLASDVPPAVTRVALTVNAEDAALDAILAAVPIDMIQLHGAETPERCRDVRARHGLPVMKAIGISEPADLVRARRYGDAADWLLLDAKPPKGAALPGGNGARFDWDLLAGEAMPLPWMLAGGLTTETAAEAAARTGADALDVSSGVERAPGVKDPDLIAAFLAAARAGTGATLPVG